MVKGDVALSAFENLLTSSAGIVADKPNTINDTSINNLGDIVLSLAYFELNL